MSHSERDAWLWEKANGDWPFERWSLPDLRLRSSHEYLPLYLSFRHHDGINSLVYRLTTALGSAGRSPDRAFLQQALRECKEVVAGAIDISEGEAYANWLKHEVWLPALDESISAGDEPAEMLVQSVLIEASDNFSNEELCAAIGLWCAGEWTFHKSQGNSVAAEEMLIQVGVALAEAEFYRGGAGERRAAKHEASKRAMTVAAIRHKANRENKERGRAIWLSKSWDIQADAERKIADECHIEKVVAGRWIREFKRSNDGNPTTQSKHSTT